MKAIIQIFISSALLSLIACSSGGNSLLVASPSDAGISDLLLQYGVTCYTAGTVDRTQPFIVNNIDTKIPRSVELSWISKKTDLRYAIKTDLRGSLNKSKLSPRTRLVILFNEDASRVNWVIQMFDNRNEFRELVFLKQKGEISP